MLGARIKEIRQKKGLTQDQLAEKINKNPKYLSSIERGKENPTLNTLISLSKALKVDLYDFTSMVEVENPKKRRKLIDGLLNKATDDQLKVAYKVLTAIIK